MVETLDILNLDQLLVNPRANVPITAESRGRRVMYQQEQQRLVALDSSNDNYSQFLRACNICLKIDPLQTTNLDRVYELTERTNQLNYSARRFSKQQLIDIMTGQDGRQALVLSASDKFGSYGIIGFAIVSQKTFMVDDFFMSCRVQRKKVDHAFFNWLLDIGRQQKQDKLSIIYRKTSRNGASLTVLQDEMLFTSQEQEDGSLVFCMPCAAHVVDADLVTVNATAQFHVDGENTP